MRMYVHASAPACLRLRYDPSVKYDPLSIPCRSRVDPVSLKQEFIRRYTRSAEPTASAAAGEAKRRMADGPQVVVGSDPVFGGGGGGGGRAQVATVVRKGSQIMLAGLDAL